MRSSAYTFRLAVPVWERGAEDNRNHHLCFTVPLSPELNNPVLSLSGCSSFVVSINGQFIAYGPARCAHGFFRVDQLALTKYLAGGDNILSIRVAGYGVRSHAGLRQPSFLCAELTDGDRVVAYTAPEEGGFSAFRVTERIEKVQRYSPERPFVEHYRLAGGAFAYEYGKKGGTPVELAQAEDKNFLVRTQPYGDYPVVLPKGEVAEGTVSFSDKDTYTGSAANATTDPLDGFSPDEWELHSEREVGRMDFSRTASFFCRTAQSVSLVPNSYADIDLGCNYTGILSFNVETSGGCELYVLYDECFGEDGSVDPFRRGSSNIFYYKLAPGSYHLHTTEPHSMRALRLVAAGGSATIKGLKMFKVGFPSRLIGARLSTDDERYAALFEAAQETFVANAADLYMDNPGRSRAGRLRDSFFTARAEYVLTGACRVGRAFLENFLLPEAFPAPTPKGLLPACYPSDLPEGDGASPEAAMFFVLELEEYLSRTDDRATLDDARPRVGELLAYLRARENKDGLLEGCSLAGKRQAGDICFPTNMLYAMTKDALARLWGDDTLHREAEELRKTIRRLSYTKSGFFCDGMTRRDGEDVLSGEYTELCQYYAFLSGVATPASYPALWIRLRDEFGRDRREAGAYAEVAPVDCFGFCLRLELLGQTGETEKLLSEMLDYFSGVAKKAGTLGEKDTRAACYNQGFASHVLLWLAKAGYLIREEE